jgi:hypothetical protein
VGGHVGGKEIAQKYFKKDYGGQLCSKMLRTMPEHVMYVSELVSHHTRDELPLHHCLITTGL